MPPRLLFQKTYIVSIFMPSDHRDGRTIRFFTHLNNQTSLYCWLYWNMRWSSNVLILKVFGCHELIHFNSRVFILDFTCNCRLQKAKKFSRNPGQFKCVTREIKYHISITELLIQNLYSQVPELVQRPRITLKILYFSGSHQVLQISPRL